MGTKLLTAIGDRACKLLTICQALVQPGHEPDRGLHVHRIGHGYHPTRARLEDLITH